MSTPEVPPNPRTLTPLVTDLLPEIEIGTNKLTELSLAADNIRSSGRMDNELSTRELEVLRYLPTMLSASDIASELYVSVNTVKAHLRSIYRKLGVSRRQAAVFRAYEDGILLPRSSVRSSADGDVDRSILFRDTSADTDARPAGRHRNGQRPQ